MWVETPPQSGGVLSRLGSLFVPSNQVIDDEYLDAEILLGRRLVAAVTERTGLDLTYVRWTGTPQIIHARDDDWRDIVIVCYRNPRGWVVRSVLKRRGNLQMRWEPNGRAGSGCDELAIWAENDFVIEDEEQ